MVTSVAFLPDGNSVAVSSHDEAIKLWCISDQKQVGRLSGHKKDVRGLAVRSTVNCWHPQEWTKPCAYGLPSPTNKRSR